MMYEVYYFDDEIEATYDYDGDLEGREDEVTIFTGTLKECRDFVKEHQKDCEEPLFIKDEDGFGVY